MSVIENMSDADVLALSNAVIATRRADLASHPPLTEEDLAAAKEKRDDFEEKLLAHDQAHSAATRPRHTLGYEIWVELDDPIDRSEPNILTNDTAS